MDDSINKLSLLLLSEGTVRIKDNKSYIVFTNTSDILLDMFKRLAKDLGHKVYKKSDKQVAIYSKELAENLLRICRSFRSKPCFSGKRNACPVTKGTTKQGPSCLACKPVIYNGKNYPPSKFPENVLNSNKAKTAEYLRIFFTCEGGVVIGSDIRNDEVIVRVGHPLLRYQVLKMLDKLDIKARIRGESLIYIKKHSEMKKFKEKVGFVAQSKSVRGFHKGGEKNKLLEFVLKRHGFV